VTVSEPALDAWRAIRETERVWLRHLRGTCPGPVDRACGTCARHRDASLTLSRELGLRPWDPFPGEDDDLAAEQLAGLLDAAAGKKKPRSP
jgi:hypothetical protein